MTDAEARIAELEAQLKAEKEKNSKAVTLKVTPKGCIGVYGIRRMPIVLYAQEWDIILGMADEIRQFETDNTNSLSYK